MPPLRCLRCVWQGSGVALGPYEGASFLDLWLLGAPALQLVPGEILSTLSLGQAGSRHGGPPSAQMGWDVC